MVKFWKQFNGQKAQALLDQPSIGISILKRANTTETRVSSKKLEKNRLLDVRGIKKIDFSHCHYFQS